MNRKRPTTRLYTVRPTLGTLDNTKSWANEYLEACSHERMHIRDLYTLYDLTIKRKQRFYHADSLLVFLVEFYQIRIKGDYVYGIKAKTVTEAYEVIENASNH